MEVIQSKRIDWDSFSFAGQTWHEIHSLPQRFQKLYFEALMQALDRVPIKMMCKAPENENRYEDALRDRVASGEITKQQAKDLFQEYLDSKDNLFTIDSYLGDITPLNIVTRVDDTLGLGFQLFGIKILQRSGKDASISAHILPVWIGKNPPSWNSNQMYQFVAQVVRGLLNTIITSKDREVRVRVDELDPIPSTINIQTNQVAQTFEAEVLAIVSQFPDVLIEEVTRFGFTYSVYKRV